jgi:hypothetical protein
MTRFRMPVLGRSAVARAAVAGAASLAAAAAALAPATTASAAPPTAPAATRADQAQYVALGDSYSAGVFVRPWDDSDGCGRSYRNYPHQVAAALGLHLTDVTCGAAEVEEGVLEPQPSSKLYGPPSIPPPHGWKAKPAQIDALRPTTRYVTVGIGGNSLGFGAIVLKCSDLGAKNLGIGSPCQKYYTQGDGRAWLQEKFDRLDADLGRMLHEIRRAAPHATVAVVGYPAIVPNATGCEWLKFKQLGSIAKGDMPWLDGVERNLNGLLERHAADQRDTYVDTFTSSEDHGVCASGADKWMYGIRDDLTGDGNQTDPASADCAEIPGDGEACTFVHPNAAGLDNQSRQVIHAIG